MQERKEANRQQRLRYPKTMLVCRAGQGARKRNIEFALTANDIPPFPKYCPVFPWIELKYQVGHVGKTGGTPPPDSPSLDRIYNSTGYLPENIRIISGRANILKRDSTLRERIALAFDQQPRLAATAAKVQEFVKAGGDLKSSAAVPIGMEFVGVFADLAKDLGYDVRPIK